MRYQKLLKIIKQHTWWEEKSAAVYQFVMYPLHCFVEQSRYFHPKYLSLSVFISTPGDFFHELTPEDEKSKQYWYVYEQVKRDPKYLIRKRRAGDRNKVYVSIGRRFERNSRTLSNAAVWKSYHAYIEHYLDYARYAVMPECVDVFTQSELEGLVKKELSRVSPDQAREITRVMAAPAHVSFMEHEHARILRLALALYRRVRRRPQLAIDELGKKSRDELTALSRDYFWTNNSYSTVIRLRPDDFLQKVKREIQEKPPRAIRRELDSLRTKVKRLQSGHVRLQKKYSFSPELMRHFKLVQYLGEWIDDRKSYMLRSNHYLEQYCQELARRFRLPVHDVRYYLPDEFKILLLHGRRLSTRVITARQKLSAYVIEKKGRMAIPTIYYGQRAGKILRTIQSKFRVKKGQVAGQVASAPVKKFSGVVQIVRDSHRETFVPGRILVASMTRPDFVPLLRRAAAIITDEGGLTCHAAIVARELKLPCIIGTKNATAEFRTGQRVTMDLETGKIIKK